ELQGAPAVAGQADGGLAAEQTAVLGAVAIAGIKAAFQLEYGAQTIAQVFGTTQTPARTGLDAVDHAYATATVTIAFDFVVADAGVDDTIESDRRLSLSGACETSQQCSGE